MSDLISGVSRFVLRCLLLAFGLVFFASLLAAALVLLVVGAARMLWARLTGQPVRPWAFRVDPRAQWGRFNAASNRWSGGAPPQPGTRRGLHDVVDVEAKPAKGTTGP